MRYSTALAGLVLFLVHSPRAAGFGFERQPTRWKAARTIEFVLNMANVPSTISQEQLLNVVERALAPWTTIATASLPFRVGLVVNDPAKTSPNADGVNMIFWEAAATPRTDMFAGKAYPMASECDILLQPQAPFTLIDVKAIIMHELGHCMGLAHSTAQGVMTKFQGLPTLGVDDAIAVSLLYPGSKSSLDETTATLTGRVTQRGRPVLGAVVRVVDPLTRHVIVSGFSGLVDRQRKKDSSGRFEIPGVPVGQYALRVEPMDAFAAADPSGYGAPVDTPPGSFQPLVVELPELDAAEIHDVGTLAVEDR